MTHISGSCDIEKQQLIWQYQCAVEFSVYSFENHFIFCIAENPDDLEELQAFKNLVLLFSELIEHDVFSHDLYVNMLISRGDISPGTLTIGSSEVKVLIENNLYRDCGLYVLMRRYK